MIQEVNDTLATVLEERGLDARTCYTRVSLLPPDGFTVELECSDAAVADDAVERLHLTGEDARRLRVLRLPSAEVPRALLVSTSVADIRRLPSHQSELVSQAVMGDVVTPLKAEGEWYLVRTDDGYVGWIRSWYVSDTTPERAASFAKHATHRVATNHAQVFSSPASDSVPVSDLVVGVPLVATGKEDGDWLAVELSDGRTGFVLASDLEKRPASRRAVSRDRLVATGMRFIGIPYLWGGSTPKGFDCSGLVQRIYRLQGVVLPRDSDQQARIGALKSVDSLDDLAPGDLLFFGRAAQRITHVAMVLPDRLFLHAYGQVRVNSLDPESPHYLPDLARDWRLARDPLA
jgi:cell wall-associated NlpC family hydrolase